MQVASNIIYLSCFIIADSVLFHYISCRWQCQSAEEHSDHEKRVAYRGMLEAVISHDGNLPRKALRRLKVTSIEDYAKTVAANLNGKTGLVQ